MTSFAPSEQREQCVTKNVIVKMYQLLVLLVNFVQMLPMKKTPKEQTNALKTVL